MCVCLSWFKRCACLWGVAGKATRVVTLLESDCSWMDCISSKICCRANKQKVVSKDLLFHSLLFFFILLQRFYFIGISSIWVMRAVFVRFTNATIIIYQIFTMVTNKMKNASNVLSHLILIKTWNRVDGQPYTLEWMYRLLEYWNVSITNSK